MRHVAFFLVLLFGIKTLCFSQEVNNDTGVSLAFAPQILGKMGDITLKKKTIRKEFQLIVKDYLKTNALPDVDTMKQLLHNYVITYFEHKIKLELAKKAGYSVKKEFSDLKKQRIAENAILDKWLKEKLFPQEPVSEMDARLFYLENLQKFTKEKQIKIQIISLYFDPLISSKSKKNSIRKILDIKKQIKKGKDFAELAKKYSSGIDAEQGGEIKTLSINDELLRIFSEDELQQNALLIRKMKYVVHLFKILKITQEKTKKFKNEKTKIIKFLQISKITTKIQKEIQSIKLQKNLEIFVK